MFLKHEASVRVAINEILTATGFAAMMVAATAFGQTAKPSPYQGVSHPPDDAIVTNDLASDHSGFDGSSDTTSGSVSQPTPHMEAIPTSPQDHDYIQHPGLRQQACESLDSDVVTSVSRNLATRDDSGS